jgi:hypothetical protein
MNIICNQAVSKDTLKGEGAAGRFESTEEYTRNPRLNVSQREHTHETLYNDQSDLPQ